jgi:hypothetical protein
VIAFFERNGGTYGLDIENFKKISEIMEVLQKNEFLRGKIGQTFVENTFIEWCQKRNAAEFESKFSSFCTAAMEKSIKKQTIWAPIAYLETESEFTFGPVRIVPLTANVIRNFFKSQINRENVDDYVERLCRKLQGLAAVVIEVEADSKFASETAFLTAQDVVTLLRFLAPTAPIADLLCPINLLGAELVPSSTLLIESDDGFSSSSNTLEEASHWQISEKDITENSTSRLYLTGRLVLSDGLSPFEADVRESLMIYSRSLTVPDMRHRLSQALAALEVLLTRHQMEPRSTVVSDRAALIVTGGQANPRNMADMFRSAFRFTETQFTRPLWPPEIDFVRGAVFSAYRVMETIGANVARFKSRSDFIDAVERMAGRQN